MSPAAPVLGVLAVALRPNEVLLVQRRNPPDAGLWGFPGGKVETGETVAQAAVRELHEETGLRATAGRQLATKDSFHHAADGSLLYHFFLVAVACEPAAGQPVAGDDAAAAAWVPDEAVLDGLLPLSGGVVELLAAARAAAGESVPLGRAATA